METSLFIDYIQKWFEGVVTRVVATLNGTKKALTFLNKRMLGKEYSLSGKWETFNQTYTRVAADVVAMDSDLPLKKRDSHGKASGEIPKMGMKLRLNERQIKDLMTLRQLGGREPQIVRSLFEDTAKVIEGVEERIEALFLQGFSTGVILLDDDKNTGTGIRLDFGYPAENQYGASVLWSDNANAKPWDDIELVIQAASDAGVALNTCFLDRTAYNYLINNAQTKELYAFNIGFVGTAPVPPLDIEKLNSVAGARNGFRFEIVDRSVRTEKNGVQTAYKPWADGRLVFTSREQVGSLIWTDLAEMGAPVDGVSYQTANEYTLVSKYRKNTPSLSEWTSSQAMVIPVISNVDEIYTIDSKTLEA